MGCAELWWAVMGFVDVERCYVGTAVAVWLPIFSQGQPHLHQHWKQRALVLVCPQGLAGHKSRDEGMENQNWKEKTCYFGKFMQALNWTMQLSRFEFFPKSGKDPKAGCSKGESCSCQCLSYLLMFHIWYVYTLQYLCINHYDTWAQVQNTPCRHMRKLSKLSHRVMCALCRVPQLRGLVMICQL